MKVVMIAMGLAMVLAAVPAEAKKKNKSLEGCVEHRQSQYELSTVGKKGKPHHYTLVGDHDFANDVGHRVRVNGIVGRRSVNVGSVHTIASSCRQ